MAALLAGGALLVTMVVLIALLLHEISVSRDHIVNQDAKITALLEASASAGDAAQPFLDDAAPLLEDAGPVLDDVAPLLEEAPPAVREARELFNAAFPALEAVTDVDLRGTLAALQGVALQLLEGNRLLAALDETAEIFAAIRASALIPRAAEATENLEAVLRVLRRTKRIQRRTLRVQIQALAVQRKSLDHIRSIDLKTGGQFPP